MKAAGVTAAALALVALFAATADAKCYGGAFFGHFRGHWYETRAGDEAGLVIVPSTGKIIKVRMFNTEVTNADTPLFFVGRFGTLAQADVQLGARTTSVSDTGTGGAQGFYSIVSTTAVDVTKTEFDLDLAAGDDYGAGVNDKPAEPAKAMDCLWLALHARPAGASTLYARVEFKDFLKSGSFRSFGALHSARADFEVANSEDTSIATSNANLANTADTLGVRFFVGTKPWEQSVMEVVKLDNTADGSTMGIHHLDFATGNADLTNANVGVVTNVDLTSATGGGLTAADVKWMAFVTTTNDRVIAYIKNCD